MGSEVSGKSVGDLGPMEDIFIETCPNYNWFSHFYGT